jgi:hypothetical protein
MPVESRPDLDHAVSQKLPQTLAEPFWTASLANSLKERSPAISKDDAAKYDTDIRRCS